MANPRFTVNNDNTGRLLRMDYQAPSYAATLALVLNAGYTLVKPGTLTGALTINANVTDAAIGDRVQFLFKCDGTSRTVTYGTNFKSAGTHALNINDEGSSVFIFDGTNFVEESRATTT